MRGWRSFARRTQIWPPARFAIRSRSRPRSSHASRRVESSPLRLDRRRRSRELREQREERLHREREHTRIEIHVDRQANTVARAVVSPLLCRQASYTSGVTSAAEAFAATGSRDTASALGADRPL